MMTKRFTRRGSSGSRITASAMLVSGPVATRTSRPACARAAATIASTACEGSAGSGELGRFAWPSPVAPCTARASFGSGASGAAAPGDTGTSARPASASTARVLRVALARLDIADDGRDSEKARPRLGAGVEEGEGVVDAGVDVDEQGFGLMRHGVHSERLSTRGGSVLGGARSAVSRNQPAEVKVGRAGRTDACATRQTAAQWRPNRKSA